MDRNEAFCGRNTCLRHMFKSPLWHMGLCVFSLLIFLWCLWQFIYFILLSSSSHQSVDQWPICHCLGLGHEAMVCTVCLSIFWWANVGGMYQFDFDRIYLANHWQWKVFMVQPNHIIIHGEKFMDWSGELFMHSQECYFNVYFLNCEATREINTKNNSGMSA